MCATWLIYRCDRTHSCVWHDSFVCVPWLIHTCRHDSFTRVDMTHAYVRHDSCIRATWLIYICRQDSFIFVPSPLCHPRTTSNTHSNTLSQRDGFPVCRPQCVHHGIPSLAWKKLGVFIRVDMTHSRVRHGSFICVTRLMHVCAIHEL